MEALGSECVGVLVPEKCKHAISRPWRNTTLDNTLLLDLYAYAEDEKRITNFMRSSKRLLQLLPRKYNLWSLFCEFSLEKVGKKSFIENSA